MENNNLHNFTFVSTFLKDAEGLPYEQRCQIIDAICYWGVYRVLPHEIENNPLAVAFLKNAQRMIEKQDEYKEKKIEQAKSKKDVPNRKITDEQILEGFIKLKKELGRDPKEQEVIDYWGVDVKRIGARNIWKKLKNNYNECIAMYSESYTNVENVEEDAIQDVYNTIQNTNVDVHKKFNF